MTNKSTKNRRRRPQSTGFWTVSVLSWLRREEPGSENSSIHSVDSHETSASFSFLEPARYNCVTARKFLSQTSIKNSRQESQLIKNDCSDYSTFYSKYGLYKYQDFSSVNTISLPITNSENANKGYRRRKAHVPGKRRAPLPPQNCFPLSETQFNTRRSRKRPAPKPPIQTSVIKPVTSDNNNYQLSDPNISRLTELSITSSSGNNRQSNIKQCEYTIFPKYNVQITNKDEPDRVTRCTCNVCCRKHDAKVKVCKECVIIENNISSENRLSCITNLNMETKNHKICDIKAHEKQKLKEMLREMKHSFSPVAQHQQCNNNDKSMLSYNPISINVGEVSEVETSVTEKKNRISKKVLDLKAGNIMKPQSENSLGHLDSCLNTPLSISSLLNMTNIPVPPYGTFQLSDKKIDTIKTQNDKMQLVSKSNSENRRSMMMPDINQRLKPMLPTSQNKHSKELQINIKCKSERINLNAEISNNEFHNVYAATNINSEKHKHLVNCLENSIAQGDENAAAEAAIKLAQLKQPLSARSMISSNGTLDTGMKYLNSDNSKLMPIKADRQTELERKHNGMDIKTTNDYSVQTPFSEKDKKVCFTQTNDVDKIIVNVWIEDKEATRGPVPLHVERKCTIHDLRLEASKLLNIHPDLQRWIVGRTLCNDDSTTIDSLIGANFGVPFYLCLVETENKKPSDLARPTETDNKGNFYSELLQIEQSSLVVNTEAFECGICTEDCAVGEGAVLRECVHRFCKRCLCDVVRHSEDVAVGCPATSCCASLSEREIRAVLPEAEYGAWLERGLATAERAARDAFHCRTPDCRGWALCEAGVRRFLCPVCSITNCVQCEAIHEGLTCEEYRSRQRDAAATLPADYSDLGTKELLDSLIERGEALKCPQCEAVISKKWGCDWLKCSACKTEICWATRGRRWGPGGRGDTSAGCRCGVDGKRCHPLCGYCH